MTVKEASMKFQIAEKEIYKSIRDGLLYAIKISRKYQIADDIQFIPTKNTLQAFLFQILKHKNNPNIALDQSLFPNKEKLLVLLSWLFTNGYITQYKSFSGIKDCFNAVMLTDKGIKFSVGEKIVQTRLSLPINININVGLVNV